MYFMVDMENAGNQGLQGAEYLTAGDNIYLHTPYPRTFPPVPSGFSCVLPVSCIGAVFGQPETIRKEEGG